VIARVLRASQSGIGKLRIWHASQHKPYEGVAFDDRTPGSVLEEFYMSIAVEVDQLRNVGSNLSTTSLERLKVLENILYPDINDRRSLLGLSKEESDRVYSHARSTGDPLADYWEYREANNLSVDLDLSEAPPRSEWDSD